MSSKILIVEDTKDTRDLLHLYFMNAGFTVVTAVDGTEGLYMAQSEKPDVIVTDLTMPNMDGLEMIKLIRSNPEIAHIPTALFTAYGKEMMNELTAAGVDKVFLKPFDFDKLVSSVRGMIQNN